VPHNVVFRKTFGSGKSYCCYRMALATLMPMFSGDRQVDFTRVISEELSGPQKGLFGFALTCPNPNTSSERRESLISKEFKCSNDRKSLVQLINRDTATSGDVVLTTHDLAWGERHVLRFVTKCSQTGTNRWRAQPISPWAGRADGVKGLRRDDAFLIHKSRERHRIESF